MRACGWCGASLENRRSDARFCDASHRLRWARNGERPRGWLPEPPGPVQASDVRIPDPVKAVGNPPGDPALARARQWLSADARAAENFIRRKQGRPELGEPGTRATERSPEGHPVMGPAAERARQRDALKGPRPMEHSGFPADSAYDESHGAEHDGKTHAAGLENLRPLDPENPLQVPGSVAEREQVQDTTTGQNVSVLPPSGDLERAAEYERGEGPINRMPDRIQAIEQVTGLQFGQPEDYVDPLDSHQWGRTHVHE